MHHPMQVSVGCLQASGLLVQEWLMDRRGRDQFVIRYGDETEVCWNDHQKQQAEQVCCQAELCSSRLLSELTITAQRASPGDSCS